MSENKNLENLVKKINSENLSKFEFESRKNSAKKEILKNLKSETKSKFDFRKSFLFFAFLSLFILFTLIGISFFSKSISKNSDTAFLNSTIDDLNSNNINQENYFNQNNPDLQDFEY